jgi:hypothetical protein
MHCFFSHLIESGYFEEIEMFFLVVGHTHNHLDQWFSVLSKAIKRSDKLMTVIALHELFRLAHRNRNDSDNKTPARIIQLTTYHDWERYYAPVRNDNIMYYNIPHRVKFGPLVAGLKCPYYYMHFSPTVEWEAKWLPVPPATPNDLSVTTNSIQLSRYVIFNGDKTVANAVGLKSLTGGTSHLMNGSTKTTETLRKMQVAIPEVQNLEIRTIAETIVRGEFEAATGVSDKEVEVPSRLMQEIEEMLLQDCDDKKGYIFWLRHTSSTSVSVPELLRKSPTVLPNPVHWRQVIAERTASNVAANVAANAAANAAADVEPSRRERNSRKEVKDDVLEGALDSLKRLKAGATKIAAAATALLTASPSLLQRSTDETISIAEATSMFTIAVLTPGEVRWLESIRTVPQILASVEQAVREEEAKEWQLLRLRTVSAEAIAAREAIARAIEERRILVHQNLLPLLTRSRDRRVVPGEEFVQREHAPRAPAQTVDPYGTMKKPALIDECRRRGVTGISNANIGALREKLRNDDRDKALRLAAGNIGIVAGASTAGEAAVSVTPGTTTTGLQKCTCVDCEEAAESSCRQCGLACYCSLHANHDVHCGQHLPPEVCDIIRTINNVDPDDDDNDQTNDRSGKDNDDNDLIIGEVDDDIHGHGHVGVAANTNDVVATGASPHQSAKDKRGVAELEYWVESPIKRQAISDTRMRDMITKLDSLRSDASAASAASVKLLLNFEAFNTEFLFAIAGHYKLNLTKAAAARRVSRRDVLEEFIVVFLRK